MRKGGPRALGQGGVLRFIQQVRRKHGGEEDGVEQEGETCMWGRDEGKAVEVCRGQAHGRVGRNSVRAS